MSQSVPKVTWVKTHEEWKVHIGYEVAFFTKDEELAMQGLRLLEELFAENRLTNGQERRDAAFRATNKTKHAFDSRESIRRVGVPVTNNLADYL